MIAVKGESWQSANAPIFDRHTKECTEKYWTMPREKEEKNGDQ
jgi:hypothetical protein